MYRSNRAAVNGNFRKVLGGWIFRTANNIHRNAFMNAPKATGQLRQSMKVYYEFPQAAVSINAPYARYVEGYPVVTKRHFHSWADDPSFRAWARRRGFDTSKEKGGLLTWGYNIPFLRSAVNTVKPQAMMELRSLRI